MFKCHPGSVSWTVKPHATRWPLPPKAAISNLDDAGIGCAQGRIDILRDHVAVEDLEESGVQEGRTGRGFRF